ncbi:autotransporter outer membrane beta-barrel domain-containing protein [Helicobacter sp. MIT 01-3238]|uniref:autotransporter outer membrane beta-barrel domain-containing protein n=1 Tax=Helicobacter sp. MIT 01-3238 TaxID=398627 RepID=UPI000E1ED781|nr:autotransporter outer membrane beta-barrel domain-containing protein [Helicobacter sp. MIT 01-3238]RDU52111.1 hypothetical protein CQA40_08285 [Helicobacter sp. MIT 01-3238]
MNIDKSTKCISALRHKRERERESSSRSICHTERSEVSKNANANLQNPLDISVSAKPQYDKAGGHNVISPSLAGGDSTYSPSLAEGVRGWVDTTSALQVKPTTASEYGISVIASKLSERGKPQISKIDCHDLTSSSLSMTNKSVDCHANANAFARKTRRSRSFFSNDESFHAFSNAKDAHPQTPLVLREGTFKKPSHTHLSAKISLAKAAIISGLFCQAIVAADFTGSMSASELQNRLANALSSSDSIYNLGLKDSQLSVGAGTVKVDLRTTGRQVNFGNISASSTIFDFTSLGGNTITASGGSSLGKLILGNFSNVSIASGASIGSGISGGGIQVSVNSTIQSLTISGAGSFVSQITTLNGDTRGAINTLTIGTQGVFSPHLSSYYLNATILRLNIYSASLSIDASATQWNSKATTPKLKAQHIITANTTNNNPSAINIGKGAIYLTIGPSAEANKPYFYDFIVLTGDGGYYNTNTKIDSTNVSASPGVSLKETTGQANVEIKGVVTPQTKKGFILQADASTSYGASVYRSLALSYMRRNAMTQNILDTMTTKTFHSDRYYNQEVELRLIQYDMSRLTNRSSKFAKQTRKNQAKIDKMRDKLAKLTLEQSKGQNLDKGYNNFEVIDQLDVMFIPYTGRRDWRVFALPYAVHSFVDMGAKSSAIEYAGGALVGLQRNLKANGIVGAYMGYEFSHADTTLAGAPATVQTNSIQAGLNYFKTFAITSKIWEGFIKATIRGGADLPQFRFEAGGKTNKIDSDSKNSSVPLMYSIGAEVRGGFTFYYFKRNSYLSPEVGLSYDMLSAFAMKFAKPITRLDSGVDIMPLGADEYYKSIYWHLPQISVALRYHKMWGNTFRTNLKVGVKYNIINKQTSSFMIGKPDFSDTGIITLPAVYGNLALDFIWMIKKNHELSLGYDGLFYASTFAKEKNAQGQSVKTDDWFNGVTTTLNLKYAYWFGGTDYVKDKEGNAISRSALENSQKKSKPKKPKKSKKKIYYIDE